MAIKHEGRSITMTMRRSWRLLAVFLAVLCVLLILRSPTVVILPLVGSRNTSTIRPASGPPVSKVAKATVATNTLNNSIINQALRSHAVQNEMHGYIHHITNQELVSDLSEHDSKNRPRGAWSKPAYLLGLIVAELAKPEGERLEWLL